MKNGVSRLLAGLMALAAAWSLGRLSAALARESLRKAALDQAISQGESAAAELKTQLEALTSDAAAEFALRQKGFIAKGDIVFFDGG